ncbi:MAG: hypothetical protein WBA37_11855 [Xanthobacteraceae bacterium]
MLRLIVVLSVCWCTAAHAGIADCAPATAKDVEMIRLSLDNFFADAPSARFKDVCISQTNPFREKKRGFCGLVNLKNDSGAYVGYVPFMYLEGSQAAGLVKDKSAPGASYCTMCVGDPICAKYQ